MEPLTRGMLSDVWPAPPRPGAEVPLVLERSHAFLDTSDGVLDGLEAEARRLAALGPPFRRVLEVTRTPVDVSLVWESLVGLTGGDLERGLAAQGRLLPLEAWLRLALELTAVPPSAPCGPTAGGGTGSLGFDVRRQLVLFPDARLTLFGPRIDALLPPAPRIGRPDFGALSPEQVKGLPTVPASRVFAVAGVLAGLLTAASPFLRGSLFETLHAVVRGELHWDPTENPACPAALAAVLRRALLPEPERRWPDLDAFREALQGAAGVAPAPLEEVALVALSVDFPRVQAGLRALAAEPAWLPAAWRAGGLRVLEDSLLESLVPLEQLPPRR